MIRFCVCMFLLATTCSIAQEAQKADPKPMPKDVKLSVLEAKSALDDAIAARKDLDSAIQNLSNQIKEQYAKVQKEEAEAQKKYDAATAEAVKSAGLNPDEWIVDAKAWTFIKKPIPPAAPHQASVPTPPAPTPSAAK
jgi:uncharacterized protein YlxW (UPF0749 family)